MDNDHSSGTKYGILRFKITSEKQCLLGMLIRILQINENKVIQGQCH